jgi:3-hydroxybutyryl-CoA dehydrogenase
MNKILNVGVAGAGAMGAGIAQVAAFAGCKVVLYDPFKNSLDKAASTIKTSCSKLVEKGKLTSDQSVEIIDSVSFTDNLNDLKASDIIIEAIIENLEVKRELFRNLESIVSEQCILATNTSSLSVVAVAAACKKNDRVAGIHFFNPAFLMPLVEIIPAFTTSEETVRKSKEIIDGWGKTTVLAKDTPGFIVNRIARPYYGEAIRIYEEGIAGMADIDNAMRSVGGFKMGPFELMDFIGNDINYKVTETVWEQMFYDPRYKPSLTQKRLFEAGLFGRKSGRGYYDYSEGSTLPEPDQNPNKSAYLFERILAMLINEAADALYLGIASRDDIDTAMTKGVNYPKGLLKWADEFGIKKVVGIMDRLRDDYSDGRYRTSLLLRKMIAENRSFY